MIILGILLILATAGLSLAVIWSNDSILAGPATTIELFGNQMSVTVGEAFVAGATMGALALLGLFMLVNGIGRNARSRSTARHQLRDHRQEMRDLQRKHDTEATRRVDDEAADSEGIASRR